MLAIAGLFPGRTAPRSQKHSLPFEWANHLTTTIAGDVLDPSREQGEVEAIELAREDLPEELKHGPRADQAVVQTPQERVVPWIDWYGK
jgi:hypothetical protein